MIGVAHSCRAVLVFIYLPTMIPRAKPPHTLVSVLHWLWYCRATALSALANLTLLLGKNTLPFPAFGNLNFVSPPHRRAYTSIPKSCPNIRFPHQQDFFPIRSVTKSSTARFSHENLVENIEIFVQDFVPIRTALTQSLKVHAFIVSIPLINDLKIDLPRAIWNSECYVIREQPPSCNTEFQVLRYP